MTAQVLRAKATDLVALVKPNIMVMALLTAAGAMSLAPGVVALSTALVLLLGTGLIVGSANTLNMWLERDLDCLMTRTKNRPLPGQRLAPNTALVFGTVLGVLAVPTLLLAGVVPAALGMLALILYVGVYTPMKQRSHWSTWVGAVPGAMPALMGWTAATGRIDVPGLAVQQGEPRRLGDRRPHLRGHRPQGHHDGRHAVRPERPDRPRVDDLPGA
ncbi:MAG TPA: protoheme IX farnesyltransferase, partial [Kofleriaceae bacterium]